jgi:hypothetical protein
MVGVASWTYRNRLLIVELVRPEGVSGFENNSRKQSVRTLHFIPLSLSVNVSSADLMTSKKGPRTKWLFNSSVFLPGRALIAVQVCVRGEFTRKKTSLTFHAAISAQ